ncbi:hypothetical protein B0H17DRAFT_1052031 [Mycena rosella]|uniref:Uncharacterized protein n=1 Tax=Mycena rosella TaxID=1033263 RepID=A0AAD7DR26_MYCRO|nr:hypothetical protein B0H17DRAFT_1052031 [Mycena rosella]
MGSTTPLRRSFSGVAAARCEISARITIDSLLVSPVIFSFRFPETLPHGSTAPPF